MDAEQQTASMVGFILAEAKNKAEEIGAVATQSFAFEKTKILHELKSKVHKDYDAKLKKLESQRAINRSTSVNKARLQKVSERAKYLQMVTDDVKSKLDTVVKDQRQYKDLMCQLIVQGSLKLLEPEVMVRCREKDVAVVEGTLKKAQDDYASEIKRQAGATRTLKLTVDKSKFLPPPPGSKSVHTCLGGVVLCCHKGLITVDNTLDARLRLIVEQDKPTLRSKLFPA